MQMEAFFEGMKAANETVQKLKKAGFDKAYVDMNGHYREDRNMDINRVGMEMSASLSDLVLESGSNEKGRGKATLRAASPMVGGYGRFEEIADVTCRVVVKAGEEDIEKATAIVKENGGSMQNFNIVKPKVVRDIQ